MSHNTAYIIWTDKKHNFALLPYTRATGWSTADHMTEKGTAKSNNNETNNFFLT